jgi:hypothetical protein
MFHTKKCSNEDFFLNLRHYLIVVNVHPWKLQHLFHPNSTFALPYYMFLYYILAEVIIHKFKMCNLQLSHSAKNSPSNISFSYVYEKFLYSKIPLNPYFVLFQNCLELLHCKYEKWNSCHTDVGWKGKLIKHYTMKTYGRVDAYILVF